MIVLDRPDGRALRIGIQSAPRYLHFQPQRRAPRAGGLRPVRRRHATGAPNRFGIAPSRWNTIPAHVHYVLKNANGTYTYGKAIAAQRYGTATNMLCGPSESLLIAE